MLLGGAVSSLSPQTVSEGRKLLARALRVPSGHKMEADYGLSETTLDEVVRTAMATSSTSEEFLAEAVKELVSIQWRDKTVREAQAPAKPPRRSRNRESSMSSETKAALIGAVGGAVASWPAALIGNYQNIFQTKDVTHGYQPTGDFETEARYYFELIQLRSLTLQSIVAQLNARGEKKPTEGQIIYLIDRMIDISITILRKYFSVEQIQEMTNSIPRQSCEIW
jgi:hypothetical protein